MQGGSFQLTSAGIKQACLFVKPLFPLPVPSDATRVGLHKARLLLSWPRSLLNASL